MIDLANQRSDVLGNNLIIIIFSKDRAFQLDACLRSFALQCGDCDVFYKKIIFKCSDEEHRKQYEKLRSEHQNIELIEESDFANDLQKAIEHFEYVLFMVDDNLFIRSFRLTEILTALTANPCAIGFSLRLGKNITSSYSNEDSLQSIPSAETIGVSMLRFRWVDAEFDFGYPLEVSSSVYRIAQLQSLIHANGRIVHPNALEVELDAGKELFADTHSYLLCYEHSVAFCNPINVVQFAYLNRAGSASELSSRSLVDRFELGYRMDLGSLNRFSPNSCHQELQIHFLPPYLSWKTLRASIILESDPLGVEGTSSRSFLSDIEPDKLFDDELYSALCGLTLLSEIDDDPTISWIEAVGKYFRKQQNAHSREAARNINSLKIRIKEILEYSSKQQEANNWVSAQMKAWEESSNKNFEQLEDVIAKHQGLWEEHQALNERLRGLWKENEGLIKRYQELNAEHQVLKNDRHVLYIDHKELNAKHKALTKEHNILHGKWWFLLFNGLENSLRFVKYFCKFTTNSKRHCFEIDDERLIPGKELHFQGWLLRRDQKAANVRAIIAGFDKCITVQAERTIKANTLEHIPGSDVSIGGFFIKAPLEKGWKIITLQYKYGGKWLTFARRRLFGRQSNFEQKSVIQKPWPQKHPLVSVVIPCYNYGAFLEEAVDSVLAQTWQDLEIIIVDDGSDDPITMRILDSINKPRTHIIRQQNLKLPTARNTGIEAASGKYICCLDADDKLAPTYIEKCIYRLEIDGVDICGSWQQNFGLENSILCPGVFSYTNLLKSNRMVNCAVFRKELWKESGGFDKKMAEGYEDWEFWIRLAALGATATIIPEPLFLYRKHGRSMIDGTLEKHDKIVSQIRSKYRWSNVKHSQYPDTPISVQNCWANLLNPVAINWKPNVLLCLPFMTVGGAEKIISQICKGLKVHGLRFTIITTVNLQLGQGSTDAWFEECSKEIYHLPVFLETSKWKSFIAYLIRSRRIDILWQAGSTFIYHFLPELKTLFPELKIVDILFNPVGHTTENRKYDYLIDINITETQAMKSWLLEHGESDDRVCVIPNGVDLDNFQVCNNREIPFDTHGRGFIVGFFGRLSEEKGPDIFIKIATALKNETDILFVIAGLGPMEKEMELQVIKEGLEESVKFLGFCTTQTHLRSCDVLVVPSLLDGRPNVVMEAMAMGVPVVASKVGGIPELVNDGYSGFLCDAGNVDQFAEKLLYLYHNSSLVSQLKLNARLYAEQNLDIKQTIADFRDVFQKLACDPEMLRSMMGEPSK